MSEKENKKTLHDDEIEKVSGGTNIEGFIGEHKQELIKIKNEISNRVITSRIIPPELKRIHPIMKKYGGPGMFCPKDITKFTEEKPTETDEKPKI